MRRDHHIFVAGLVFSLAAHAAAFVAFRAFPIGLEGPAVRAAPLALIAVPAAAEATPLEIVQPTAPAVPSRPAPEPPREPEAPTVVAAPAADASPAVHRPAPQAAPVAAVPTEPDPVARRLAHGRYEQSVAQWVERQRAYPLAARRRGWEGTAIVRLHLAADGSLLMAQLVRDTGFALLDEAALGMVRRAAPFPRLPEEIGDVSLEVLVPIHFSLGG